MWGCRNHPSLHQRCRLPQLRRIHTFPKIHPWHSHRHRFCRLNSPCTIHHPPTLQTSGRTHNLSRTCCIDRNRSSSQPKAFQFDGNRNYVCEPLREQVNKNSKSTYTGSYTKNMDAQNISSVQLSENIRKPGRRLKILRKGYFHRQLLIHRRKIALKKCMSKRHQNIQTANILDAWIDCIKTLTRKNDIIDRLVNNQRKWERAFDYMELAMQNIEQEVDVLISRRLTKLRSKRRSSG
uniref:Uncharacterized protein LOC111114346 isoform X2 n=1 Tax=Crassostrea virginica TaxID=6565 RepID=A0A8B8BZS9_CRAVI|nr:uncharacterized protein LOC111114346 isoform X2 [Crassostrea virginica]